MNKSILTALFSAGLLVACAGRDPAPVATSQPQDTYASCAQIQAEIMANNSKVKELADEKGWKTAQNVTAGVVGLVVWPIWFGMDFKGAADKDTAALQARQQYLAILATERCAPAAAPEPARRGNARTQPRPTAPAQRLPPEAYYQPPPPPPPPPTPSAPQVGDIN